MPIYVHAVYGAAFNIILCKCYIVHFINFMKEACALKPLYRLNTVTRFQNLSGMWCNIYWFYYINTLYGFFMHMLKVWGRIINYLNKINIAPRWHTRKVVIVNVLWYIPTALSVLGDVFRRRNSDPEWYVFYTFYWFIVIVRFKKKNNY